MEEEYTPPDFKSLDAAATKRLEHLAKLAVDEAFEKMRAHPRRTTYTKECDLHNSEKRRLDNVCSDLKQKILDGENPPNLSFDIRATEYDKVLSMSNVTKAVGISVYYNPNYFAD